MELLQYIFLPFIRYKKALPIQIDITNACNLACSHCYHNNHFNSDALSLEKWFSIVDQYYALRRKIGFEPDFIICGGEPLVSEKLLPLIRYIRSIDNKARLTVLTNGTMFNECKVSLFTPFIENLSFQVSLDGPNEKEHDYFRGIGSFQKSIRGIKLLVKHGFFVEIQSTLSKRNADLVEDFFRLSSELRVNSMNFTRLIPLGQAAKMMSSPVLNSSELKRAYTKIVICSARYGVATNTAMPLMNLVHPVLGSNGRFWECIVIDYQGNFVLSSRSKLKLSHVNKMSLEEYLLLNPILMKLRRGEIEGCKGCPYIKKCGGDRNAAYAVSGDVFGADPGCWLGSKKNKVQEGKELKYEIETV